MDYKTLKTLIPAKFENAADGYRATSDMASAAKDHIEKQVTAGMRKSLEGETTKAALKQLSELAENFHYTQVECGLIGTALNGFAYDLAAAKNKLDAAIDAAQADKFTVNPDGTVSYPSAGKKTDGEQPPGGTASGTTDKTAAGLNRQAAGFDPNPNYARAQEYADRIAAAIREATEADEKWAPKLRALKADDDLSVSARDWSDAQADMHGVRAAAKEYVETLGGPPKDGTPQDNAKWWKSLTAEERADYVAVRPASAGALDGLPADVRDEANRMVLAEKQGQYEVALKAIPPEPANKWVNGGGRVGLIHSDEWMDWHRKYGERKEHLENALNGMQKIQDRFDSAGAEGLPEAYLLGFNAEGNGRAVIATGNPDTADHTAVYVPGTTSNLGKIGGDIDRMTNLWREANAVGEGASVSTITWLGYDAPQSIVKDAPFKHYADDGAPSFNQFLNGLDASRTADSEGHRTVIGHSYGTTLIGSAARQGDLSADDVVFAGSPGVQVGSASEMDVPRGHVWNQEAAGDPVPDIGRYGHGGSQFNLGGGVWLIPSDDPFGANQMTTDTHGHSDYWDSGTTSLENQAQVVLGRTGNVDLEE
ncbi:alpha/beta hydrolase [Streptomyces sp. DSM 118878]